MLDRVQDAPGARRPTGARAVVAGGDDARVVGREARDAQPIGVRGERALRARPPARRRRAPAVLARGDDARAVGGEVRGGDAAAVAGERGDRRARVRASHRRAVPSQLAVTTCLPSGAKLDVRRRRCRGRAAPPSAGPSPRPRCARSGRRWRWRRARPSRDQAALRRPPVCPLEQLSLRARSPARRRRTGSGARRRRRRAAAPPAGRRARAWRRRRRTPGAPALRTARRGAAASVALRLRRARAAGARSPSPPASATNASRRARGARGGRARPRRRLRGGERLLGLGQRAARARAPAAQLGERVVAPQQAARAAALVPLPRRGAQLIAQARALGVLAPPARPAAATPSSSASWTTSIALARRPRPPTRRAGARRPAARSPRSARGAAAEHLRELARASSTARVPSAVTRWRNASRTSALLVGAASPRASPRRAARARRRRRRARRTRVARQLREAGDRAAPTAAPR